MRSGEITAPGFVHDLFATNLNLFLGSPVHAELGDELARHGLGYATSAAPFANLFADGRRLGVWADGERTLAELERHDPLDAAGWRELAERYERLSPALFAAYAAVMPSRTLLGAIAKLGPASLPDLGRLLVGSTGSLASRHLHSPEAQALLACWGLHLGLRTRRARWRAVPVSWRRSPTRRWGCRSPVGARRACPRRCAA